MPAPPSPDYLALVAELGALVPGVAETQMMGMPALKRDGKLFAGCWDGALAARVGRDRAAAMVAAGTAELFDPSGVGRPMRDWVLVGPPADRWLELALDAETFTCGPPSHPRRPSAAPAATPEDPGPPDAGVGVPPGPAT